MQKNPRSCADPVNGRKPKGKEKPNMHLVPQALKFSENVIELKTSFTHFPYLKESRTTAATNRATKDRTYPA